jgi:RNA polymerase sigma-70 factor (ECF subfamily)
MSRADSSGDTAALSERAARGDREALEELLVRHLPRLRAFVRLRAGPAVRAHEETSDLVQSVCREVLENAPRFRHPSDAAFRQWLFAEALRKIGKRARYFGAQKRDVRLASGSAAEADLAACYSSFTTPSEHASIRQQMERVENAFDALSEEQREIVTLAHVVGLSRAEIARQMGSTEGAVRVALHRALARIAALLDEGESAG